ncbi:MAG: ABC transporter permease subunit [Prevotellaceae bacterium]|jgi:ABC-type transport system involved in multi-copper enzyme maturation permease subunit|nr:ABC transporter permease subunit [Prevotellaceae bacterium]
MISLLVKKDFLLNLTSARFIIGLLLCLFIIPFTLIVSMDRYNDQQELYKVNIERAEDKMKNSKEYSSIRPDVVRQPESLSIFSEGISENIGMSTTIYLFQYPLFLQGNANSIDNPLLNAFFSIDFATVIAIIMSLLALVFSYDCFTLEREDSTIKMIFVNKISRSSFFIGKLCGILLTLLPILVFCYILSFLFIVLSPKLSFSINDWGNILLLFLSSIVYVIVFVLLGMFISSMVKRSSSSIIISLLAWIWFLFLMPNIASYAAHNFVKTRLYDNVSFAMSEIDDEFWKEDNDKNNSIQKELEINGLNHWNMNGDYDGRLSIYGGPRSTAEFYLRYIPWYMPRSIDYADKKWAIQKDYFDGLARQEKIQQGLALLSPSEIFLQLSSALCHTDANSFIIYMDKVREYRQVLITYFKENKFFESSKWFTSQNIDSFAEDEIYQAFLDGYSSVIGKGREIEDKFLKENIPEEWNSGYYPPLDLNDFPKFTYKSQISGKILNFVLIRFALLLFLAIILLMATMLRFRKYQL